MSDMVNCPTCNKKISLNAKVCPNCGEPITDSLQKKLIRGNNISKILAIIIAIILIYTALTDSWTNKKNNDNNIKSNYYDKSDKHEYNKEIKRRFMNEKN